MFSCLQIKEDHFYYAKPWEKQRLGSLDVVPIGDDRRKFLDDRISKLDEFSETRLKFYPFKSL